MRVGILRIPNRPATSGKASVSTFATTTDPVRWLASLATSGATARHGPHHAAQKSTKTGTGESRISSSNSSALPIATGCASGTSGALQAAHRAVAFSRPAGTRLDLEHEEHGTIMGALCRFRTWG